MGAANMPAAEVDVTPELVRALLRAQHPDLADRPVSVLANGWDNVTCRLGDDLLVRLPRRQLAAPLVEHEQRWLPVLAPRLPLPVPAPVRVGRPALGYPWSWSVVPYLPGEIAARVPPADLREAAATLGEFLAALGVPAPKDAPANASRGIPLATHARRTRERIAELAGQIDAAAAGRAWARALARPPWSRLPAWVHGDLHTANILVERGRISGILDFGDITAGDPATDLAVAWMLLPADCHPVFRASYSAASPYDLGEDTWGRARGWALALSVAFLANSADNELIAGIGRRTLAAVLADSE